MKERLSELLKQSYSPYSHFPVAAVVVMKDGQTFSGVNVENASYGATICAERSAIVSAVSAGYRKNDFDKLYIMVDRDEVSTCCFMCRQVILEFMDASCEIICMNHLGDEKKFTVRDFCPYPFDSEDLK